MTTAFSLAGLRCQALSDAGAREGHARFLEQVAEGLDDDGLHPEASRARARAETLRESAEGLRAIAGPREFTHTETKQESSK